MEQPHRANHPAQGVSHSVPAHVWGDKLMAFPGNPMCRPEPGAAASLKEGASSRVLSLHQSQGKEGRADDGWRDLSHCVSS